MSFIEILSTPTKSERSNRTTKRILLTPTKRKRLTSDTSSSSLDVAEDAAGPSRLSALEKTPLATSVSVINGTDDEHTKGVIEVKKSHHTNIKLYQWTFTRSSIAPCFAVDALNMDLDHDNDDMYWLGRVPCRTVRLVGMIVAVDNFEDMTRLKIDDGTAVIDCDCKHPKPPKAPSTPNVKRHRLALSLTNQSSSRGPTTRNRAIPVRYQLPDKLRPPSSSNTDRISSFADRPAFPHADVGMIVRVTGRVMRGRGSRFLRVELGDFAVCQSPNEEPQHWLEVIQLHRESYDTSEPFLIPKNETQRAQRPPGSRDPVLRATSPSASSSIAPSSPIPSSSPTKDTPYPTKSPQKPRLRHPSKLRTRDLTDVTFRIYLKYYMDFAPPYPPRRGCLTALEEENSQSARCTTPTPSSRTTPGRDSEAPRLSNKPLVASSNILKDPLDNDEDEDDFENSQYGFTLSYLRRVPVLAELARAVVRAERKRREREGKQREKAELAASQASGSVARSSGPSSTAIAAPKPALSHVKKTSPEPTCRKMKRLFRKTIRELYSDGSVVLWTGPARHWSHAFVEEKDGGDLEDSSRMWKTSTSVGINSHSIATTSITSDKVNTQTQTQREDDSSGELSEPNPKEEAYISVTATTMAPLVLRTIRTLTTPASQGQSSSATGIGKPRPTGRRHRPPTASEILAYLHALDMRWERLGPWVIDEVLEKLKKDDRIYQAGEGRWALCV